MTKQVHFGRMDWRNPIPRLEQVAPLGAVARTDKAEVPCTYKWTIKYDIGCADGFKGAASTGLTAGILENEAPRQDKASVA